MLSRKLCGLITFFFHHHRDKHLNIYLLVSVYSQQQLTRTILAAIEHHDFLLVFVFVVCLLLFTSLVCGSVDADDEVCWATLRLSVDD